MNDIRIPRERLKNEEAKLYVLEPSAREAINARAAKINKEIKEAASIPPENFLRYGPDELTEHEKTILQKTKEQGAIRMYISLPPSYHQNGQGGFQEDRSGNWNNAYLRGCGSYFALHAVNSINFDLEKLSGRALNALDKMDRAGFFEMVGCGELTEEQYKEIDVEVDKVVPLDGWLNKMRGKTRIVKVKEPQRVYAGEKSLKHSEVVKDGNNEIAYRFVYVARSPHFFDDATRPGNNLILEIAMPESLAKELHSAVSENPYFMRRLADLLVIEKFGIPEDGWKHSSPEKEGRPLGPPYELEAKLAGGTAKMYIPPINPLTGSFYPGCVYAI